MSAYRCIELELFINIPTISSRSILKLYFLRLLCLPSIISFMLPQQNAKHFSSPSYVTVFPSHSTLLDLITLKIFGELYKS